MELCRNIGVLFKAIPASISIYYTDHLEEDTSQQEDVSFLRKIKKLEAENNRLTVKLNYQRDQVIKEYKLKGYIEEEANKLRPALQAA